MRHNSPAAALALFFIAACGGSSATPVPSHGGTTDVKPVDPALAKDRAFVDKHLTAYVDSFGKSWGPKRAFSGYVHMTRGGDVLYSRAFGYADHAAKRAANADTNFRIGSVTKQFTAAGIMLLEADGKLALNDPIKKFIPDYPEVGANITVHQLLTHTSGIFSYTSIEAFMEKRATRHTPRQIMELTWNMPLRFPPGSKWEYSNSGYVVLGAIIEKVSGKSYAQFMKERVFTPAGLTRTVVGDATGMSNRSLGYQMENDAVVPAKKIEMSNAFAAGAVRSTANDLIKWHRVLSGTSLLSDASKKKLYTVDKQDYAYGWGVVKKDGRTTIGHGGGIDGFLTNFARVIEPDIVVVVWNNTMNGEPGAITKAALKAARGGVPEPVAGPVKADPALMARCAGTYEVTAEGKATLTKVAPAMVDKLVTMTLTVKGDGLFFKPTGAPGLEMTMTKSGDFAGGGGQVKLECKPGAGQTPAKIVYVKQGPLKIGYTRKP